MITEELQRILELEGYTEIREVPSRGICGLCRFIFTSALVIGLDNVGYYGRYCYPTMSEAKAAFDAWDGTGDPSGDWIKYKGWPEERSNPNLEP